MIRVAVVDDDKSICDELVQLLKKYEIEHALNLNISVYYDGESLLADMEEETHFDLLLLDIELSQINGVDVGHHIRKHNNDYMCQIIYISSKTGYALKLFQIRPFDFLVKPITADKLFQCLDEYTHMFQNEDYFEFTSKGTQKRMPVNRIMYFESNGRKLIVCCNSEKHEYYGKLSDLLEMDILKNFIMIHKSFFVNISHIADYRYETLITSDGTELSISKPNRKEVRRLMLQYSADKFITR